MDGGLRPFPPALRWSNRNTLSCVDPVNCKCSITFSCLATDATDCPQSFLLQIAEVGGSVARRHNHSERPRRLSATSPRLAACMVSAICSSAPGRSSVKDSSCLLHPLNSASVKRKNCSDCLIQLLRAAEQLDGTICYICARAIRNVRRSTVLPALRWSNRTILSCVDPVDCK